MLGVILLAFASILLLSNLVTALSTFFLAKDLDMLIAAPVDWLRLYLAKLGETVAHSSWMVALLAVPIFTAYGIVYDGGPWFWLVALGAFVPFLLLPGVIGAVITLVLVNVFPARRTRDLLSLVAIGAMAIVVVTLRVLQPERLARPEGFRNLVDFLGALQSPTSPFLPTEWTADIIMNWLNRVADPLPIVLLWSTAGAFVVLGALAHKRLYRNGFTKAQEGAEQYVRGKHWPRIASRLLGRLPVAKREFIVKDVLLFFRDTTQWSQLILLAVLLLVYIFNIRALPLFTGERVSVLLVTMVVFLNLALAGFVLAAIAARFVFPSVSLEGKQLWLLCSSPLDLEALMWSKYWTGTVPLLLLALLITGVTNVLLQASPFMMAVSIGTITLYTLATSALALCFGDALPPVRHRERRADPHELRRAGLHDGERVPARRGDRARGAPGAAVRARQPGRRAAGDGPRHGADVRGIGGPVPDEHAGGAPHRAQADPRNRRLARPAASALHHEPPSGGFFRSTSHFHGAG